MIAFILEIIEDISAPLVIDYHIQHSIGRGGFRGIMGFLLQES